MKSFIPVILFKFDTNVIGNVGKKVFLIAESEVEGIQSQTDLLRKGTGNISLSKEKCPEVDHLESGDILFSGNYYFQFSEKENILKQVERSVINSMISM